MEYVPLLFSGLLAVAYIAGFVIELLLWFTEYVADKRRLERLRQADRGQDEPESPGLTRENDAEAAILIADDYRLHGYRWRRG